jgi:hypothetical protein
MRLEKVDGVMRAEAFETLFVKAFGWSELTDFAVVLQIRNSLNSGERSYGKEDKVSRMTV